MKPHPLAPRPGAVLLLATLVAAPMLPSPAPVACAEVTDAAEEVEAVQADVAPFARATFVDEAAGGARHPARPSREAPLTIGPDSAMEYEWDQPRGVRTVRVRPRGAVPGDVQVILRWWRRIWPDGGKGGWMKLDDPFNGQWATARTTSVTREGGIHLGLAPLDADEAPGAKSLGADHRTTYRIRVSATKAVQVEEIEIGTGARERSARIRFEGPPGKLLRVGGRSEEAVRFEARNGTILSVREDGPAAAVVEVRYVDAADRLSPDRGHLICRAARTRAFAIPFDFSVFIDDVLREGGLLVRDIDAFVSDADRGISRASWQGPTGDVWAEGTVRKRVAAMAEQSFAGVRSAIPEKPRRHVLLGVPDQRQEFAIEPDGRVRFPRESLRSPGPDLERCPWISDDLLAWVEVTSATDDEPVPVEATRDLEGGWLPVVRHAWRTGDLEAAQTFLATVLAGDIAGPRSKAGTETVVLVTRLEVKNVAAEPRTAVARLRWSAPRRLRMREAGLLDIEASSNGTGPPGLTASRGRIDVRGKGSLVFEAEKALAREEGAPPKESGGHAVRYAVELPPGVTHAVDIWLPFVELLDGAEVAALRQASFEEAHESAVLFWKERTARGMSLEVPDEYLNELFKANLWHVLISTDADPTTGLHQHGAATVHYKNYLNETAMVAESLEMRGEHEEARKLLEPFIASQGTKGLPGNFRSREGVFYASHPRDPDPYTAQGYNMHHGWGLWQISRHFLWTRDEAFLRRVAPGLVAGCDWVIRERQATRVPLQGGARPVEYGLAPAGDLEDVEEYLYFYATNAYYWVGMHEAARVLGLVGHPEAGRLAAAAREYLEELRASITESVATTPVVRLRDGNWVPCVPQRTHALTHLKEGWIREALYSSLHLSHCGVLDVRHPFTEWLMDDLEDNIFLSQESGYGIKDPRAMFFHLGGFTLQPCLVDLPMLYLERGERKEFLRGFYNTAWVSLYPDAACFAEWVPSFGRGGGPLYKTPDECKFIQWMRQMLVFESGSGTLELGRGVPLAWMRDGLRVRVRRAATLFGPLDLEIESRVKDGEVRASARLDGSRPPSSVGLWLRHPDGKPPRSILVNGAPGRLDDAGARVELPAEAREWEIAATY